MSRAYDKQHPEYLYGVGAPEVLPPEPQESALVATDGAKLRTLADWFDHRDDEQDQRCEMIGIPAGSREVQSDLRRMARALDDGEWALDFDNQLYGPFGSKEIALAYGDHLADQDRGPHTTHEWNATPLKRPL